MKVVRLLIFKKHRNLQNLYTKKILIYYLHLFHIFVYIFLQIICILNYYFKKRWMLKTQTYVSETFFFQIAKTIILYWGILWGNVPQLKLFIINKVHLLYDVNYTNPENSLKNAHLDRTISWIGSDVTPRRIFP